MKVKTVWNVAFIRLQKHLYINSLNIKMSELQTDTEVALQKKNGKKINAFHVLEVRFVLRELVSVVFLMASLVYHAC